MPLPKNYNASKNCYQKTGADLTGIHCRHCGYQGKARRRHTWLSAVAAVLWVAPVSFLMLGYWPFLIVPAMVMTVWAWLARKSTCPRCGHVTSHNTI